MKLGLPFSWKREKVKGIIFLGGMYDYDGVKAEEWWGSVCDRQFSGKTIPEDTGSYPKALL